MNKFTVWDFENKIGWGQFSTKDYQYGPDYNKKSKMAENLQAKVCKLLKIPNNGQRIGTHINIFNEAPQNKILY